MDGRDETSLEAFGKKKSWSRQDLVPEVCGDPDYKYLAQEIHDFLGPEDDPFTFRVFGIPYSSADLHAVYKEFCERSEASGFQIVFSRCSMNMVTGEQALRIVLPDGGGAEMRLAQVVREKIKNACKNRMTDALYRPDENGDCQEDDGPAEHRGEVAEVEMVSGDLRNVFRTLDVPGVGEMGAPTGELFGEVVVKPVGGGKPIRRPHWDSVLYARKYKFSYQGTMSPAMVPTAGPVQLGKVWLRSEGTAYITDEAPGGDIIREFYSNFERRVVPSSEANSLMGGMIAHLAELTKHGVPLELEQESSVKIMGVPTFGKAAKSEMEVHDGVHLLSDAEWCATGNPPQDWKLVSLEEFYKSGSPAGDGGQPPGTAPDTDEAMTEGMSEAQTEIDEAFEDMSPVKKKIFGKLFGKSKKGDKESQSDPPKEDS